MIKPIAIIAGEPNSISSEIIFKSWKLRKKYRHKPFFIGQLISPEIFLFFIKLIATPKQSNIYLLDFTDIF